MTIRQILRFLWFSPGLKELLLKKYPSPVKKNTAGGKWNIFSLPKRKEQLM